MGTSDWIVKPYDGRPGSPPPWEVVCPRCSPGGAPIVSSDEHQAGAWAQFHHETPMLPVQIGWAGDRPGADWIYPVIGDCIVKAVLRLPAVSGVETGYGHYGWVTGIYGPGTPLEPETLLWLSDLVVAELDASPFALGQDGPVQAEPVRLEKYMMLQSVSNYAARQIGWSTEAADPWR